MGFYASAAVVQSWAQQAGVPDADAGRLLAALDRFVRMVETEGRLLAEPAAQEKLATALGLSLSDFYLTEKLALATGRVVKIATLPPPAVPSDVKV